LEGLGALRDPEIFSALSDKSPGIREHALRLAESRFEENYAVSVDAIKLAKDNNIRVRFQAALSLGETTHVSSAYALYQIANRDLYLEPRADDYWMRTAILSSSLNHASDMIALYLQNNNDFLASKNGQQFLRELARLVGSRNQEKEIMSLLKGAENSLAVQIHPETQRTLILGLADGLVRSRSSLAPYLKESPAAAKLLTGMIEGAKKTIENPSSSTSQRKQAIKTLAHASIDEAKDPLSAMLNRKQTPDVQLAALNTLSGFNSVEIGTRIAAALPDISPSVKKEAIESLLGRKAWIGNLLKAVVDKSLTIDDIDPARRAALMKHEDEATRTQATQLFSNSIPRARDKVIEDYQTALKLEGDVKRGEKITEQVCIACHKIGKKGNDVGPNLATIQNRSPGDLMIHILDPNREVQANYRLYIVQLKDGRAVSGFIVTESPASITLKRTEGVEETLLRQNIKEITGNSLSLMPEGLEQIMDQQQMSDLLAYLLDLSKAK